MQIYLVGGAVRDKLLGKPVRERDYVVVGATPAQLIALGYTQVGKDFPVFLHPQTKAEHALARTERKNGRGYTGFSVYAAPDVTLEQDLIRRDLTVNAIAEAPDGTLIDPFGGRADIAARVLRHVSPAFIEDPLRVLRVARFAARFAADGFQVAPETIELMQEIARSGELDHLAGERVWHEFYRALCGPTPWVFLTTLNAAQALTPWFTPWQDPRNLDRSVALLQALQLPLDSSDEQGLLRLATVAAPLSTDTIKHLAKLQRWPNDARRHALVASQWFEAELNLESLWQLLQQSGWFKQPAELDNFRPVLNALGYSPAFLQALAQVLSDCADIDVAVLIAQGLQGAELGAAIRQQQLQRLAPLVNGSAA